LDFIVSIKNSALFRVSFVENFPRRIPLKSKQVYSPPCSQFKNATACSDAFLGDAMFFQQTEIWHSILLDRNVYLSNGCDKTHSSRLQI